ncbi:LpqB family beta-propeller domain-containing protein [Actinoplanes sp. NPDC049599]|uniref:LpqB family beta-propeller domain-containing protein n=1 Tax=Actinoplanes sp. NPDC049599 TaxID=3363903 RepID=UPI00379BBAB9
MRRRFRLLLAAPLAAVLLAAGCGIPDSTDVQRVGPGPSTGASTSDDVAPIRNGREASSDPRTFVNYYLEAAAGDLNGAMDRVKEFLSPTAGAQFRAPAEIRVIHPVDTLVNPGSDVVTLRAQTVGVLGRDGTITPPADFAETEYKLTVASVAGQDGLFVTKAPPFLLLTDDALNQFYERRKIYFWNLEHTGLVPDVRYLPRDLPSEQVPNEVIKWLIDGPSARLDGAVEALPEGTLLDGNVPAPSNDTLQINLSGQAVQPPDDAAALERLGRQLMWSLRLNLPRTLELKIGTQETAKFGGTGYLTSNAAYALAATPERFLIYNGQIRRMSDSPKATEPVPVLRPEANRSVRAAALAGAGTRRFAALVVNAAGKQELRLGATAAEEQVNLAKVRLPAGVTGQPVWAITSDDPHVPAVGLITVGGRLYSFSTDSPAVTEVGGAGAVRSISTVAVAPDGRRLALVAGGRLWVAVLSTSGDGVQMLQPVPVLTAGLRQISAVDWSSETWLTVAGARSDRNRVAIYEMTVDGSEIRSRLDDIGTDNVSYLTAYPVSPVSGSDSSDTVAYVAKGAAFDVLSGPVRIGVAELAVPVPNSPPGAEPTAPFFLR